MTGGRGEGGGCAAVVNVLAIHVLAQSFFLSIGSCQRRHMGKLVEVEFKSVLSEWGCKVFEQKIHNLDFNPCGRLLGRKL